MVFKPQKCCLKTLDEIKSVLESGKLLQKILIIAPFGLLFGAKLKPSPASTISFGKRDWDLWLKSISSVNQITRLQCKKLCEWHLLHHRSGPEKHFWQEMTKSFS